MRTLLLLSAVAALNPGCTCEKVQELPAITGEFTDNFDRPALGPDWHPTDPDAYRIEGGELVARKAHNHPLWLARPIPRDAAIEFDCWSNDPAGDLKVEVWG